MRSSSSRRLARLADAQATPTTYRAEICRRNAPGRESKYYDSGELSPYCMESLVDLLRSEVVGPYESVGLDLEIKGRCTHATVQDLAHRFAAIVAPNVHVSIRANGQPTMTMASPSTPGGGGLRVSSDVADLKRG